MEEDQCKTKPLYNDFEVLVEIILRSTHRLWHYSHVCHGLTLAALPQWRLRSPTLVNRGFCKSNRRSTVVKGIMVQMLRQSRIENNVYTLLTVKHKDDVHFRVVACWTFAWRGATATGVKCYGLPCMVSPP